MAVAHSVGKHIIVTHVLFKTGKTGSDPTNYMI